MRTRRKLGDACYDFFVRDGRDGETWGPYDTPEEARKKMREVKKQLARWSRCVITLQWELNEDKIIAAMRT